MARKRSTSAVHQFGAAWAAALRDVLIASINKGQFPFAILGLILLTLILKMPSEDVSVLGWYVHARYQRRVIAAEIERMAAERNTLQSRNLGQQRIKSSRGRQ